MAALGVGQTRLSGWTGSCVPVCAPPQPVAAGYGSGFRVPGAGIGQQPDLPAFTRWWGQVWRPACGSNWPPWLPYRAERQCSSGPRSAPAAAPIAPAGRCGAPLSVASGDEAHRRGSTGRRRLPAAALPGDAGLPCGPGPAGPRHTGCAGDSGHRPRPQSGNIDADPHGDR